MGKLKIDFSFYELLHKIAEGKAAKAKTPEQLDKVVEPATLDTLLKDHERLKKSLEKI